MTALSHASVPPPHALDEDYRLLKAAVEEAGRLAHSYFRQEVAVRRKKDASVVRAAGAVRAGDADGMRTAIAAPCLFVIMHQYKRGDVTALEHNTR